MSIENLTVVVPFWNGQATIGRLLESLPPDLPVVIVDDHSDTHPDVNGHNNVRTIRPQAKGFFAGAVNAGLLACKTDVLVLNQDIWFTNDQWLDKLADLRRTYAIFGDGVSQHPAWPKGYVQGTFMFLRRDAISVVGGLNDVEYPLWGATCEWQLRACRAGFKSHVSRIWRKWMGHEGRHDDGDRRVQTGRRQRYGSQHNQDALIFMTL